MRARGRTQKRSRARVDLGASDAETVPELCQRCDTHAGAAAGLRVMEENHAAAPPSDLFLELADFEQAREAVVERFFDLAVVRAVLDGRLRVAVRVARRVRGHRLVKRLRSSHASIAPDDDRARARIVLTATKRARAHLQDRAIVPRDVGHLSLEQAGRS